MSTIHLIVDSWAEGSTIHEAWAASKGSKQKVQRRVDQLNTSRKADPRKQQDVIQSLSSYHMVTLPIFNSETLR